MISDRPITVVVAVRPDPEGGYIASSPGFGGGPLGAARVTGVTAGDALKLLAAEMAATIDKERP